MKLRSGTLKEGQEENQPNVNEDQRRRSILLSNQTQPKQTNKLTLQQNFDNVYSDLQQPGAFTKKLKRYFRKNETASLHKTRRKKFPRRRIVTQYPGQIIQSDLIDMQKYSAINSGYNFMLVVIDCFSKKLWIEPLKNKSGRETAEKLRKIFLKMRFPVQSMIFDRGLEYVNQWVDGVLQEYRIHSYHTNSPHKASTAERVNRTIKSLVWKYFTETGKKRWIDIVYRLVDNYNNTYHSSIKMTPNEVTWENRKQVFKNLFPRIMDRIKCRLKRGDKVRILLKKDLFEKGFTQNWSKEIFEVIKIFQKQGVCWYRLRRENGDIYPKSKYFFELNKV